MLHTNANIATQTVNNAIPNRAAAKINDGSYENGIKRQPSSSNHLVNDFGNNMGNSFAKSTINNISNQGTEDTSPKLNFDYKNGSMGQKPAMIDVRQSADQMKNLNVSKPIIHAHPSSPSMHNAAPEMLVHGAAIGSMLQTRQDTTPTRVATYPDSRQVNNGQNLSELSHLSNLPKVPAVVPISSQQPVFGKPLAPIQPQQTSLNSLSAAVAGVTAVTDMNNPIPTQDSKKVQYSTLPASQPAPQYVQQPAPVPQYAQYQQQPAPVQYYYPPAAQPQQPSAEQEQIPVQQNPSFQNPNLTYAPVPEQKVYYYPTAPQQYAPASQTYAPVSQSQQFAPQQQYFYSGPPAPQYASVQQPPQPGQLQYPQPEQRYYTPVEEARLRADYSAKFSVLRDAYQSMNIPEPAPGTPIYLIETQYREYVKKIMIDSSVEQNKMYLLVIWLVIEVIGLKTLNLPILGYTKNQFKYMTKYQMLLIELGENAHNTAVVSPYPIEVRIGWMAIMNATVFVLVHYLVGAFGVGQMADQLQEMINNMLTETKGQDVLKRAQEATADNIPPKPPTEAAAPLGGNAGMGGIIADLVGGLAGGNGGANGNALAQLLSGFMNQGGTNGGTGSTQNKAVPPPVKKRPTPYGGKPKQPAE